MFLAQPFMMSTMHANEGGPKSDRKTTGYALRNDQSLLNLADSTKKMDARRFGSEAGKAGESDDMGVRGTPLTRGRSET